MGILDWFLGRTGDESAAKEDDALVARATEHVVRMVDPRIKLLPGYEKKLRGAIEHAIGFCREFGDRMPPGVPMDATAWNADPLVRALFATAADVSPVFSRSPEVQDFFAATPGADRVFAVLRVMRREERGFGMQLQGEVVQQDVAQTAVNFSEKRVVLPSATEEGVRREIMRRVFQFLTTEALEQISSADTRRKDLKEQRSALQTRLAILHRHGAGLESVLERDSGVAAKVEDMEQQLAESERALGELPTAGQTLEYCVDRVKAVLFHPEQYLDMQPVAMRLNAMNILVTGTSTENTYEISLPELRVRGKPALDALIASFPHNQLISRGSLMDQASRQLG